MSVLVRTARRPEDSVRQTSNRLPAASTQTLPTITPLTAGFRKNVAQVEQIATIVSLLGSIGIFLAVVGLLGLVSYAVSQRTKEIAIRLAIGAGRKEIFLAVLRRFVWPVGLGWSPELALPWGSRRFFVAGFTVSAVWTR